MLILLDNGHGKNTKGKCSPIWEDGSQLLEWKFNRDVVKIIAQQLNVLDIEYKIIVPEDKDISLSERCRRINEISSKRKSLLISIHANAGGGTGWEAWTSPGITKSDKYAEIFYNKAKIFFGDSFPIRKCMINGFQNKEALFKILIGTNCPAVLTENFFMDTKKDCEYIMSDEGVRQVALMHVEAICQILDNQ